MLNYAEITVFLNLFCILVQTNVVVAMPTVLRHYKVKVFVFLWQVLVIIDAKPKDLGLPTDAYVAVEEVHDVSLRAKLKPICNFCSG